MPNAKPEPAASQRSPLIDSALRTLETEAGGIAALVAAIRDGLAAAARRRRRTDPRGRSGRVIVTGMGKSGHIGRKIAATFASTGTPAFFVHPERGEPRRPRHDHAGRRDHGAVLVGRDGRAEGPDRLFAPLPHRPDRRDGGSDQHARASRRRGAAAAAGARGLPAQSRADHLLADAACARRCARGRAA